MDGRREAGAERKPEGKSEREERKTAEKRDEDGSWLLLDSQTVNCRGGSEEGRQGRGRNNVRHAFSCYHNEKWGRDILKLHSSVFALKGAKRAKIFSKCEANISRVVVFLTYIRHSLTF